MYKYLLITILWLSSLFIPAYAGINASEDCRYTAEIIYNFSELRDNKVALEDIILELFQYGIENNTPMNVTQSWIVTVQYIYSMELSPEKMRQSYLDFCLSEEIV